MGPLRTRRGFTLVELIATTSILLVLAAVAIPAITRIDSVPGHAAARRVARDVEHARDLAVLLDRSVWVDFDAAADAYSVFAEPTPAAGRAAATLATDEASGRPFTVRLSDAVWSSPGIASASFGSGDQAGFTRRGVPIDAAGAPLTARGHVAFVGGARVVVEPETGHVSTTLTP